MNLSQTSRKTPFTHRKVSRILKLFLNAVCSGISPVNLKVLTECSLPIFMSTKTTYIEDNFIIDIDVHRSTILLI